MSKLNDSPMQNPTEAPEAFANSLKELSASYRAQAYLESIRARHASTEVEREHHCRRAVELRRVVRAAEDAEVIASSQSTTAPLRRVVITEAVRSLRRLLVQAAADSSTYSSTHYRDATDLIVALEEALEADDWIQIHEAHKVLPRKSALRGSRIAELKRNVTRAIVENGNPLPILPVALLTGTFCTSLRHHRILEANARLVQTAFAAGSSLDIQKLFASWDEIREGDGMVKQFEQFVRNLVICSIRAVVTEEGASLLGVSELRFLFDSKQNGGGRQRPSGDHKTGHAETCAATLDEVRALCAASRGFDFRRAAVVIAAPRT